MALRGATVAAAAELRQKSLNMTLQSGGGGAVAVQVPAIQSHSSPRPRLSIYIIVIFPAHASYTLPWLCGHSIQFNCGYLVAGTS